RKRGVPDGRACREHDFGRFTTHVAEPVTHSGQEHDAIDAVRPPAAVDPHAHLLPGALHAQRAVEWRYRDERFRELTLAQPLIEAEHDGRVSRSDDGEWLRRRRKEPWRCDIAISARRCHGACT